MSKWIAALIVVFAGLGGALLVPIAEAQRGPDAPRPEGPRPDAPRPPAPPTGMWQIVTHEKLVLLLNTASGETYRLREHEGELHWQPIPRPGHDGPRPDMPRGERPRDPDMPRGERPDRPPVEKSGIERLEDEIRMLREKLRSARDEERPRIEARIKELLEKLKGADRPDQPRRPEAPREGRAPEREREFEEAVRREVERRERERHADMLNEKIAKLERELDKTLRAAEEANDEERKELKERAKALEKDLKALRSEREKTRKRD